MIKKIFYMLCNFFKQNDEIKVIIITQTLSKLMNTNITSKFYFGMKSFCELGLSNIVHM